MQTQAPRGRGAPQQQPEPELDFWEKPRKFESKHKWKKKPVTIPAGCKLSEEQWENATRAEKVCLLSSAAVAAAAACRLQRRSPNPTLSARVTLAQARQTRAANKHMQERRGKGRAGQKRAADGPADGAALRGAKNPQQGARIDKAAAAAVRGVLASHVQMGKRLVGTGQAPRGASSAAAHGVVARAWAGGSSEATTVRSVVIVSIAVLAQGAFTHRSLRSRVLFDGGQLHKNTAHAIARWHAHWRAPRLRAPPVAHQPASVDCFFVGGCRLMG